MLKFKRYLLAREFTWLVDCSGAKKFPETESVPTHAEQRARQQMALFNFKFVHRPQRMMREVDALNRYNFWAYPWRETGQGLDDQPQSIKALITVPDSIPGQQLPYDNLRVEETGPTTGHPRLGPTKRASLQLLERLSHESFARSCPWLWGWVVG